MIYNQISQIVFVSFIILSLFFTLRKNYQALLALFIAGIGFGGFNIYLGTLWFPYKVVSVFIVIIILFNSQKNIYPKFFSKLIIIFIIAIIASLIFQPSFDQTSLPIFQKSTFRPFIQLFTYVSLAALIPFCLLTLRNKNDYLLFIKRYFLIVELVMAFALFQFIIQKLGIDFMPILRPNIADSPTAAFNFQNTLVMRLYGVTGEPKTLSAFLFPYFFISLYNFYNYSYNRNYIYHLSMLLVSLFVIINAFSSAVLLSLGITLILTSMIWFKSKIKFLIPLIIIIFSLQYFSPGKLIISSGTVSTEYSLYDLIVQRTTGRLLQEGSDRPDYLGLKYIIEDKPSLLLTGIGMGMYPYFVTSGGSAGIEPINSNWVVLLLDLGLIGIGFFIYLIIRFFIIRRNKSFRQNKLFNFALIGLVASYLLGLGVGSYQYIMLFLGLTLAIYRIIKKENKESNNKLAEKDKSPLSSLSTI